MILVFDAAGTGVPEAVCGYYSTSFSKMEEQNENFFEKFQKNCGVLIKFVVFFAKNLLTSAKTCDMIMEQKIRGCCSMVEFQPSKLAAWVRFPSPAPENAARPKFGRAAKLCALSSAG